MLSRTALHFATTVDKRWVRYGVAILAVAAAAAVRAGLGLAAAAAVHAGLGLSGDDIGNFPCFYPAVLLAVLVGGLGPGLLATLASTAIVSLVWIGKPFTLPLSARELIQLSMYAGSCLLMVGIVQTLRAAVRQGFTAQERFRIAQEGSRDAFVILEPLRRPDRPIDFRWTYANPAAETMRPAGADSLVGLTVRDAFPDPDTGAAMAERLSGLLERGGPDELEVDRVLGGSRRIIRSSGVRLGDGVAVTFRDVTDERQAGEALRASEARFRALAESAPLLIWSTRADGWCDYLSPQWLAYTGAGETEHHGEGWMQAVHPDEHPRIQAAWRDAIAGVAPYDVDYRLRRHDGVWRWFKARGTPVRDGAGTVERWFGASADITEIVEARQDLEQRVAERTAELERSLQERARTEAALAQAQRLETVGRLTGGVAHDFNNLLTVIIGGLDMILRAVDDRARLVRYAEAALAAGRRGERLTRQLLAFSRTQEVKPQAVELSAFFDQAEPLLRRAVDEGVRLSLSAAPDAGFVQVDPAQFEAALLNLVVNAADATPAGGEIRVSGGLAHLAEGQVPGAPAGTYGRVAVSDTGAGMTPEVLERVFDPFFTTKEVGKGTGLGLAQVYGFVRQYGGAVVMDSAPGEGTVATLYLPIAEPADVAAPDEAVPPPDVAGVSILLVEDDASVRAVTEGLLVEFGCRVSTEPHGRAALDRLRAGERFDLLISDVIMPEGISGIDLARFAAGRDPDLAILLTTGYAGDRLGGAAADLPWPILRKPFLSQQLAEAVAAAVGQATA